MFVVLPQRVAELPLVAIDDLRPSAVILVAKYPALDVLGFNHEHTEAGDEHMIDLRCAIRRTQHDIMKAVIVFATESQPGLKPQKQFAEQTFESAGLQ